jgi:PAS domain-containing protein
MRESLAWGELNRRKDGSFYDEEMRFAPVRDSRGATTGYVAIKHDVTKQRAVQDAQAFLAAIVEGSNDAVMAANLGGLIRAWNRGAEAVFGYLFGNWLWKWKRQPTLGIGASLLPAWTNWHFNSVCSRMRSNEMSQSIQSGEAGTNYAS